ncbi:MAG: cupin domain-containing protein [Candidatus Nanopelagicales bacterium]
MQSFRAFEVPTEWIELSPEKAITAGVSTSLVEVAAGAGLEVGVWQHSAGTSTDTYDDEVFVVIEGRGTVTDQHGNVIELAPGVVGILTPADETTWVITEPLRKVWIVRGGS